MKVLTGESYTIARLASISHEAYVSSCESVYEANYTTKYAFGYPKLNNGIAGLLIDENSQYYGYLPDVHKNRLIDVIEGDGWNDTPIEQEG